MRARETGLPGTICFPNITPHDTGIGAWSDGEVLRALREGVDRDALALVLAAVLLLLILLMLPGQRPLSRPLQKSKENFKFCNS